jgi:hypothetical protein
MWEMITMDFVSRFPKGRKGNDTIWVIIDRLINSLLFLLIKMTDLVDKLAKIYINKVVWLHGIPISIVSDRDLRFTSPTLVEHTTRLGDKIGYEQCNNPKISSNTF